MNWFLKLEYAAIFCLCILFLLPSVNAWWLWLPLLLLPDIGMIGYIFGPRIGAYTYNVTHFFGTGIVLGLVGVYAKIDYLVLLGVIVVAHSSLDRLLGFGLKYTDSFKHTHLGTL